MKCKTCRELILLYDEGSEEERQQIKQHISTCENCHRAYQEIMRQRAFLKSAFASPELSGSDQESFTDRIMTAVIHSRTSGASSYVNRMLDFLDFPVVRYGLTLVSVLLITFFIKESALTEKVNQPVASIYAIQQPKTSVLNNFNQELKQAIQRADTSSVAAVLMARQSSQTLSLYKCIQLCKVNQVPDKCEECKTRYAKLKIYEKI